MIFGGTAVDGVMGEEFLQAFPCVDIVSQGDADDRIVPLVRAILNKGSLESVPGVLFKSEGRIVPAQRRQSRRETWTICRFQTMTRSSHN